MLADSHSILLLNIDSNRYDLDFPVVSCDDPAFLMVVHDLDESSMPTRSVSPFHSSFVIFFEVCLELGSPQFPPLNHPFIGLNHLSSPRLSIASFPCITPGLIPAFEREFPRPCFVEPQKLVQILEHVEFILIRELNCAV